VDLNRRDFLALTGSAIAVRLDARGRPADPCGSLSVLHLEDPAHLVESVKGYQRAFETLGRAPAAVTVSSVAMAAHRGATVIIESGVTANDALSALGVKAGKPRNLWPRDFGPATVPYISYTWPAVALVRDFSSVLPLRATGWREIAHVDDLCVGVTRRVGNGRVVVLGSPLGPVLHAGDREAHEWLAALLDLTARRGSAARSPRIALAARETADARSRA
jgi:hypothetical protein